MILEDLVAGRSPFDLGYAVLYPSGAVGFELRYPERVAILPGAFNPLHLAHRALWHAASEYLHRPVWWELSVVNVDKPELDAEILRVRLDQFGRDEDVVLVTRAPTFAEKAALFPGATFVVGYDTAARVVDPARGAVLPTLVRMRSLSCRFLVAGRVWEGEERTVRSLAVPLGFGHLFEELPRDMLPVSDVSSTALREATQ